MSRAKDLAIIVRYLSGVDSDVQNQIDTSTNPFVDSTEIGYLDNATSNIQQQINNRLQVANANISFVTKPTALSSNNALKVLINDRMQVANVTSAVSTAVNNLVDAAPDALNTLNELSVALGDDANFASTVTNSLATKAANTYVNETFVTKSTALSSNNALNTLIDDRLQVANADATFVTKSTALTSNTVLKVLIDDRLQIANADILYVTKSTALSSNNDLKLLIDDRLQVANATSALSLKADLVDPTFTSNVIITGSLEVDGDFVVSGNVVTINATELSLEDNMIYLNSNNTVSNPDLGFAGNYNDGTYQHAGFFRDATDGYWKVYDSYTLEPDASPFIDISHGSFALADIQAANFRGALVGNADTATKLATARSIALGGDLTGSANFDGSAGITITAAVVDDSHNHIISNVDGLQSALDLKAASADVAATYVTKSTALSSNNELKVLIDDRIQVANADSLYVTKSTALSSNNALKVLIDDRLQVANLTSAIGTTIQAYDSNLTSFVNTFTLPTSDGTTDQVLKTDGAGNITFGAGGSAGGGITALSYYLSTM